MTVLQGWGCAITSCEISPALDVVGLGTTDGRVILHNLRFDQSITTFKHAAGTSITAISFRRDQQEPTVVAADATGVISVWDLEHQKLKSVIKDAHDGSVTTLHFFPGEPVLLSVGRDNCVKVCFSRHQVGLRTNSSLDVIL